MNPTQWEGLYYLMIAVYSIALVLAYWAGYRSARKQCKEQVAISKRMFQSIADNRIAEMEDRYGVHR
jgi:hypothetical protein